MLGTLGTLLALALFAGVAVALTAGFASFFPPMVVLPGLLLVVLLVSLLGTLKRGDVERAPLEAASALVVDERTKVTGGRERNAETQYFATLQFRDGRRRELEVLEQVRGKLTPGDIGVAYTRARWLVGFSRFPL